MSKCANCSSLLPDGAATCPTCRAPRGAGALAVGGGVDRILDESLARIAAGDLLDRETLHELTRDLDPDLASPLAPSELRGALARIEDVGPSLPELEGLLTVDTPAMLDGIKLGDLIDRGTSDVEVLRKGFVFLKRKRYADAVEWWSLHRQRLDPGRRRSELLLLLLEAYTHNLAGQPDRAQHLYDKIRQHPLFAEYRKKK
jgi:hypothetical protein